MALGAAIVLVPPPGSQPADRFAAQVAELRSTLAKRPLKPEAVESLVAAVEAQADVYPEHRSQARLALGTAHERLAEDAPHDLARWSRADREFAQVDVSRLTPTEQPVFQYRRAKAEAALGTGDPKQISEALLLAPPGEDDPERHRLLALTLERLPRPNLAQVKQELSTYLKGASKLSGAAKAELKERLAEIHLSLNEPDAARTWLKDLDADASPRVRALAQAKLGMLAASEGRSLDAAGHFEAALNGNQLPVEQRAEAQYRAGLAWLKQNQPAKAKAFLQSATETIGTASQAAHLRLAELALRAEPGRAAVEEAVGHLKSAVHGVTAEGGFHNPLATVEELRNAYEQALNLANEGHHSELAVAAAENYQAVATPGRAAEAKADALSAWAASLQLLPATAAEASGKFRTAAEQYAQLAKTFPTPAGQADYLRKASKCFRYAGDDQAAVKVIAGIEQLAGVPDEVLTAAWVERGEALVAVQDFAEGTKVLREAVAKASSSTLTQARVKLATAQLDQAKQMIKSQAGAIAEPVRREAEGLTKLATDLLEEVTKLPAETVSDKDAQALALFELGQVRLKQGELVQAEERFRKLVTTHPKGEIADQARLYLGCTLLQLGRGDHQNDQPPPNSKQLLGEAAQLFEQLGNSPDRFLQTQADIRLANTLFLLERFDDLPKLADRLTQKHQGTVEELIVLSLKYSAERLADQPQSAAKTFADADRVYQALPETAFTGQSEEYTRDFWKRWLSQLKGS